MSFQAPAQLSDTARRRQRARSIAIALSLGFMVLMFYLVTIAKLGPQVLNRAL